MTAIAPRYDELIRFSDVLIEGSENEFIKFTSFQERCRKKWFEIEEKYQEVKAALASSEAERERFKVQLKMARYQLDQEMTRRLKAEKYVDHMARQIELIRDLLKDQGTSKKVLLDSIERYDNTRRASEVSFYVSYTDEDSIVLPNSLYDTSRNDIAMDETTKRHHSSKTGNSNENFDTVKGNIHAEKGNVHDYLTSDDIFEVKINSRSKMQQSVSNGNNAVVHRDRMMHHDVMAPANKGIDTNDAKHQSVNYLPDSRGKKVFTSKCTTNHTDTPGVVENFNDQGKESHKVLDGENISKKESKDTNNNQVLFEGGSNTFIVDKGDRIKTNDGDRFLKDVKRTTNDYCVPEKSTDVYGVSVEYPIVECSTLKPLKKGPLLHSFASKVAVKLELCVPCKKRIRFGSNMVKCKDCKAICHPKCMDLLPIQCNPITKASSKREGSVGCYVYDNKKSPQVPELIIQCIDEIERRGLEREGLYSVSGSSKEIKELKENFLRKKKPDLYKIDTYVLCGCIKEFLKGLSEPLISFLLFESFVTAVGINESDGNLSPIYQCISELPKVNRETLAAIIVHLQKIIFCSDNRKSITNLSKIFGPTLVGHRSPKPSPVEMLEDTKSQPVIVRLFLEMPRDYWCEFLGISPIMIPNRHTTTPEKVTISVLSKTPETPEKKETLKSKLGSIDLNCPYRPLIRRNYDPNCKNGLVKERSRRFFDSPK